MIEEVKIAEQHKGQDKIIVIWKDHDGERIDEFENIADAEQALDKLHKRYLENQYGYKVIKIYRGQEMKMATVTETRLTE